MEFPSYNKSRFTRQLFNVSLNLLIPVNAELKWDKREEL